MESMQSSLFEAAAKGCVDSLQQLLIKDPLILERCFVNRFNETPLHVAAMLGHIDFVNKIIEINPQLVCELNLQKHTPLHLAAAKGHVEVVKALLSVDDRVTCLARDSNGLAPVHLAAMKGRDEAVKLLLEAQPDAARMLAYEDKETILHLCVKNNQIEALKLIVATVNDAEFVNSKDVHGNTALHLAVADKQVETTKFLVSLGAAGPVEVNAHNEEGLTAMDVLIRSRRDVRDSSIEKSLKHAGGVVATETTTTTTNNSNGSSPGMASTLFGLLRSKKKKIRSSEGLLAMATLIATIIAQSAANPPGGVWQEDNFLMDSQGHYVDPQGRRVSTPVDSHNNTVRYPHQAGYSVLARNDPEAYQKFRALNQLGFGISLSAVVLVMSGTPLTDTDFNIVYFTMTYFALRGVKNCYDTAVKAVTPKGLGDPPLYTETYAYIVFLILQASFVSLRQIWLFLKFIRKQLRARRRPAGDVEDRPEIGRIQGAASATSPLPVV